MASPNLEMKKETLLRQWHNASEKTFLCLIVQVLQQKWDVPRLSPRLVLNNHTILSTTATVLIPSNSTFTDSFLITIMVLLVTSDNEQFNADKDVVERSVLIKNMLEGECRLLPCGWTSSSTALSLSASRCWWIRSAYPSAQRFVKCVEEGKVSHYRDLKRNWLIYPRFSSTANTIAVSPCLLPIQTRAKMKLANGQRTSANGTKSLSRSIRRCSLR